MAEGSDAEGADNTRSGPDGHGQSLDEIAAVLGPFQPPANSALEPEFQPETPRPVPSDLKRGPWARMKSQAFRAAMGIGAFLWIVASTSAVRELSYYILPLAYLHWIGPGIIAAALAVSIFDFFHKRRLRYVIHGRPFVARVLENQWLVTGISDAPQFKALTGLEFIHPETGVLTRQFLSSHVIGHARQIHRYETTLRPGDYITVVCLPGKLDKTARVYGYLGLNPAVDFLRKDGAPLNHAWLLHKILLGILGIVILFMMIIAILYVFDFRYPIDEPAWTIGFGVLAGLIFFGTLGFMAGRANERRNPATEANARALAFIIGVFGAVSMIFLIPLTNSFADPSPPKFQPVRIVDYWQETTNGLFRSYEIEYAPLSDAAAASRRYPARVEHMARFDDTLAGVVEVKQGNFGWAWIRAIHPLVFLQFDPMDTMNESVIDFDNIAVLGANAETGDTVALTVALDDGRLMKPADELVQHVTGTLEHRGALREAPTQ